MFNIFFRTVILYISALFVIRVLGKGELSQLDPFQLVFLFMIAELAAMPIASPDVAVITGATAMIGLLLIQVVVSLLSIKIPIFNKIVKGKASIIIEKGKINEKEMKKYRMTIDDLSQQLRIKNFPSIADVDYAILEANGDMSVIPKPGKNAATREDLGLLSSTETLPMVLIADGTLYHENLRRSGLDEKSLRTRLEADDIKEYSQVYLCFIDETKTIHVHTKPGIQAGPNSMQSERQRSEIQ